MGWERELERETTLPDQRKNRVVQCGRELSDTELENIRLTARMFPNLSRWELAETICEHLDWRTASGSNKIDACMKLLDKIEDEYAIELPKNKRRGPQKRPCRGPERTVRTDPGPEVIGALKDVSPVWLEIAGRGDLAGLWEEYVDRYHYLGYKKPIGFRLRYFIRSEAGVLGCILVAGAAKSIGVRDRWIGWTDDQRLRNLGWVVNNSRFVIFPWVTVRYLASHVLGLMARRIGDDYEERWGFRPILMETFVDPERFQGTCYRAAGWVELGRTTGEGMRRRGKRYTTTPKIIFTRSLVKNFRQELCSNDLRGRPTE